MNEWELLFKKMSDQQFSKKVWIQEFACEFPVLRYLKLLFIQQYPAL